MTTPYYSYDLAHHHLSGILGDLEVLAGNVVGNPDESQAVVCRRIADTMTRFAALLENAACGKSEPFAVFPSASEILDDVLTVVDDDDRSYGPRR